MTQRIFCGCGDQIVPDDGAECGNCVAMRGRPEPVARVQIAEDYHPHVVFMKDVDTLALDQQFLYADYIDRRQWRFDPMTGQPLEQSEPEPVVWQGLTTAERKALWSVTKKPSEFAELIEAKLKEKNDCPG